MAAAAAAKKKQQQPRLSDSSSEDEEALQRMREAAWLPSVGVSAKMSPPSVNRQGDDGNELQTSAGFRAHVAQKLAAILDRSVTTCERPSRPAQNGGEESETEEDGFRLFSSSVPGDDGAPKSAPSSAKKTRRERSHSSSSSDEEWQKCREAAVTAADILKQSRLPRTMEDASEDNLSHIAELGKQKKKKKKKKMSASENGGDQGSAETSRKDPGAVCRIDENGATMDASRRKKWKEKRKKVGTRIARPT